MPSQDPPTDPVARMSPGAGDDRPAPGSGPRSDAAAFARVLGVSELGSSSPTLRVQQAHFQAVIDTLPQIFWAAPPEGGASFCNARFHEYTGLTLEQVQGSGWMSIVHPEDLPGCLASRRVSLERSEPWEYEYRLQRRDGEWRWFLARAEPVRDETGKIVCWVGTATDHHDHKMAEERQRFLSALTERTRTLLNPDAVVEETLRAVGGFLRLSRYIYAEVDTDAGVVTARREFFQERGVESTGRTWSLSILNELAPDLRAGRTTVNRDAAVDPRTRDRYESAYKPADVRAIVTVPLLREGRWVGYFSSMTATPRDWTAEEVSLLEAVAEQMWIATENARLFRETRARAEREALINRIGDGIRQSLPPEEIEEIAMQALGETLHADRCYLMAVDLARDSIVIAQDWCAEGVSPLAGQYRVSDLGVDFASLFPEGNTLVVADARPESERRLSDQNAATNEKVGVTAFLNVPFFQDNRIIGALGVAMADGPREWTPEEIDLAETVAGQLRSAVEAVRAQQRERNIAQHLQDALQPPAPPLLPGLALASYYRPALQEASVGGDYFDVFAVEKGNTALVVADLSGKGLAAAQQVATVRNMLRFALYNGHSVQEAVTRLHHTLVENDLLTGFATLFVGLYDHVRRTLTYVNCGQEPGLLWRAATQQIEELNPTGPVLGGFGVGGYEQETITLRDRDVLALFTDGLTEVGPTRTELLMIPGVSALLSECCAADPILERDPQSIVERLIAGVNDYAGSGVRDDIALLLGVVRIPHGADPPQQEIVFAAPPSPPNAEHYQAFIPSRTESIWRAEFNEECRREEEREHLLAEQQRLVAELQAAGLRQRRFLREMLQGFTEGRLRLCDTPSEMPAPLPALFEPVLLTAPALRTLRKQVESAGATMHLPRERLQDFKTAVNEAGMNAVRYGGGGVAHVHSDPETGLLQVWIVDNGPGIAEDLLHRAVERGFTTGGFGHGFFFIQSCADRTYLLTGPVGTTLVLEIERIPPAPAWL